MTTDVGDTTWRQLHGIESRSDERRRRDAWGKRRRRHAYRTGKHRRLERTHANHGLLHRRNLETFKDKLLLWLPGGNLEKDRKWETVSNSYSTILKVSDRSKTLVVYLCERSSCGSHRHDLLVVRLLQLRSAVLGEFLWQFKHLPYTSPLWK